MIRIIRRLLRISVTVQTTKRRPTDYDALRDEMCRNLAAGLGREWPPAGKAGV